MQHNIKKINIKGASMKTQAVIKEKSHYGYKLPNL